MIITSTIATTSHFTTMESCISPSARHVNFGKIKGESASREIEITNNSDEPVRIRITSLNSQFVVYKSLVYLEPFETKKIEIIYRPIENKFVSTQIRFISPQNCNGHIVVSGDGKKN